MEESQRIYRRCEILLWSFVKFVATRSVALPVLMLQGFTLGLSAGNTATSMRITSCRKTICSSVECKHYLLSLHPLKISPSAIIRLTCNTQCSAPYSKEDYASFLTLRASSPNMQYLCNGLEDDITVRHNLRGERTVELDSLVGASGKMILLHKLLPKLQAEGHKVACCPT